MDAHQGLGEGEGAAGAPAAAAPAVSEATAGEARPAVVPAPPPRHIQIIVAGVFAVSLLKGLRMPNLWSATHMTFNYTQGFIRRGLFGQVLRAIGGRGVYHYNTLALIAVVMLVLALLATARLTRRMLATDGADRGLLGATLAFAASPGLVFVAHEIGYLDYVGFIALPLFIVWAARGKRLWPIFYVAIALSIVLALIHESMIIMFAPTMWLAMTSHVITQSRAGALSRRTRWLMAAHVVGAAVVALAASSVIGTLGTKNPERVHALQASIQRHANFPLRGDAFEVLFRSVREAFVHVMPWVWSNPENVRYLVVGILASLPGLVAILAYGVQVIARLPLPRLQRLLLGALLVGTALGPLLLNFVGWDSARWNAICFVAAFNGMATIRLFFCAPSSSLAQPSLAGASAQPGAGDVRRFRIDNPWMLVLAAAAIVCGLTADYSHFLFDGYVVRWFPFDTQWRALLELVHGNFGFIPAY
jgi:hypothetical protein